MKQKYFLFALLSLIVASCTNQEIECVDAGQVQVTAGIAKSRVSFNESGDKTYAYWQTGDAITLSTPTQGNLNYTATVSEDDATVATFAPEANGLKDIDGENVYACYPASAITDGVVNLPATNNWTDAKPLPFAYAVSSITESKVDLSFEYIFAFLKLTLSADALENAASSDGDKSVHGIVVKSASEALGVVSGTFNFADKSISITEESKEVSLTLGTAFNPSKETERSVYIPILPQSGDVAMTISLKHSYDGGEDVLLELEKRTPTGGFVAGHVYTLTLSGNSSAIIDGARGEIHLAEAGLLSNYITADNKNIITTLKITGYLNGDDIRLLREMAGRDVNGEATEGVLTNLDISEATIVEGGGSYFLDHNTENYVVGECMFEVTNLKEVLLPINSKSIGIRAFRHCTSLNGMNIPEAVTAIGKETFSECSSLERVSLPNSLLSVGDGAFSECTALNEINMPTDLISIGISAFCCCSSLTELTFANSLAVIDSWAFGECTSLKKITLPNSIETIGGDAFNNCTALSEVILGENLTTIGESAFQSCSSLTAIDIPNKVTTLGQDVFFNCSSLSDVTLGNSVEVIGESAFLLCASLETLQLPESVKTIGKGAFKECTALTDVVIPDNVSIINQETFADCAALKSVKLGKSVTEIGSRAFENCGLLEEFDGEESVVNIRSYAFYDCASLKSAISLDAIELVESYAFARCESLNNVILGERLKEMQYYAFAYCSSLVEMKIPDSVELMGSAVFADCSSLTNVILGEKMTTIETSAFSDCISLEEIVIPNAVTSIGDGAFGGCSLLKSAVIGDGVSDIGQGAFRNCVSLAEVRIGKGLGNIKDSAFEECHITECYIQTVTPPTLSGSFYSSKVDKESTKLYVPVGSVTAYQESDWSKYFANIMEIE